VKQQQATWQEQMKTRQTGIELFPDPAVSAVCGGVPILAYGDTHVLQASPDLVEPESLQVGNPAPPRKLALKRSADISFNQLGGTTPRMPRTGRRVRSTTGCGRCSLTWA
jgi:hypothetical protein